MRRLSASVALLALALPLRGAEPDWVAAMKEVRANFKGTPGTVAHFGDSITVSRAYWTPLAYNPPGLSEEMKKLHAEVKKYAKAECLREWKGSAYGNEGRMTIRWAHDNVDAWLKKLNPEAVVILFGTNDVGQLKVEEYERKLGEVVGRCLKNGTVVILTTPPPKHGALAATKTFADAVRRVARDARVPLIDYHKEILDRRPDDWDGALARFKDAPGDEYQVPTLIARDGVHPSNPSRYKEYNEEGLKHNGFVLRNYLTLQSYGAVMRQVLRPAAEPKRGLE